MTIYTGIIPAKNLYAKGSLSPGWMSATIAIGGALRVLPIPSGGPLVIHRPMPLRKWVYADKGLTPPTLTFYFYNRILVEPSSVSFGSIVSDQVRPIRVSNLYLTSRSLTGLIRTGFGTGLLLNGPDTPLTIKGLQTFEYTLTATLSGGPSVLASLTFQFSDGFSLTIPITGDRVVLYAAIFGARVKESLVWLTDVLVASDGSEQRIRVRQSPRQQLSVTSFHDIEERNRIDNLLYSWRHRIWAIPLWIEARKASSPVAQGDMTVSVDTRYGDFRLNSLAVVWESPRKFDVFMVTGITSSSLSLARGINASFSDPYVMPVRSARMISDPIRKTTGYSASVEASFEVMDNLTLSTEASSITYLGEDTYLGEQLAPSERGTEDKYQKDVRVLDYHSGAVEISSPWSYTKVSREVEFLLESAEAIWSFRKWLHRRAGKLRPFYAPSRENNLRLKQSGIVLDVLYVAKDDYTVHGKLRIHLAIRLTDGSYLFRTVINATDNETFTLITIDTPLNVDASSVDEISLMGLKRLNSDRIEIDWQSNEVALSRVPYIEIKP